LPEPIEPPIAPLDPAGFRANVLRRAARIERRRRTVRALGWTLGILAVVTSSLALVDRHQSRASSPSPVHTGPASVTGQPAMVQSFAIEGGGRPIAIVGGSDANLWATVQATLISPAAVVRSSTDGRQRRFSLPTGSRPAGIVAGADGALWIADPGRGAIDRVTTDGAVTTYLTPGPPGDAVTLGSDGDVWFAEPTTGHLARITPDGTITQFATPTGRLPGALAAGPDGNIWFAEANSPTLARMTTAGAVSQFQLPDAAERVTALASGPGPSIWFALNGGAGGPRVAYLDSQSQIVAESPQPGPAITALTLGPDGRLWYGGAITDSIETAGLVGQHPLRLARAVRPASLATGADGAVWAADPTDGTIVRIVAS
jgi:virginiamycin B lyase